MQQEGFQVLFKTWSASEGGTDKPCQLSIALGPDGSTGIYLIGTLSVEKTEVRMAFPLCIDLKDMREFLDEARRLSPDRPDGKATMYDYDYQPVLVLSWVPLQPPVLVVSGEYTSYLIPQEDELRNVEKYPYQAQDNVEYSGIAATLTDVGRLVAELRAGLEELGIRWADTDCK